MTEKTSDASVPHHIQEQIKAISIRGRMALAITCLDTVLSDLPIDPVEHQSLLDILWQFVEMEGSLSQWDHNRRQHALLMDLCDYAGGWTSSKPTQYSFEHIAHWVYKLIFEIDELGLGDLYGAVRGHSTNTYECAINVLQLMVQNGYAIPSLAPFLASPFTHVDQWGSMGWGPPTPRTFFTQTS